MSWDGNTITLSPPLREDEGFGCPACGAPLSTNGTILRRASVWGGMACCGYYPTGDQARRLALAGQLLEGAT